MNKKIYIGLIVILLIAVITLYLQKQDLYLSQRYELAVPHIELSSAMLFYGVDAYNGQVLKSSNSGDIAIGKIVGFVKFPNLEDQPRGAWQYYIIEATDSYDETGTQLFTLEEIIKMPAIAPRYFEKEILKVTSNTLNSVTLESEQGNNYQIDKRTDEVVIADAGGDVASLITRDSEYRDFMLTFLK